MLFFNSFYNHYRFSRSKLDLQRCFGRIHVYIFCEITFFLTWILTKRVSVLVDKSVDVKALCRYGEGYEITFHPVSLLPADLMHYSTHQWRCVCVFPHISTCTHLFVRVRLYVCEVCDV